VRRSNSREPADGLMHEADVGLVFFRRKECDDAKFRFSRAR